jgi:hypothetical protein
MKTWALFVLRVPAPPIFFLFEKPVHTAIRNCFEGAFIEEILFVKA